MSEKTKNEEGLISAAILLIKADEAVRQAFVMNGRRGASQAATDSINAVGEQRAEAFRKLRASVRAVRKERGENG